MQTQAGFADTTQVRPSSGEYQVMYAFDMPYNGKLELTQPVNLPIDNVIVLFPQNGIRLASASLSDGGTRDVQGVAYHVYSSNAMQAGSTLEFSLSGRPGQFRRLLVSALTKPEDEFARRDPAKMSQVEYDRWYCTPYISSIAYQVREVLPGVDVRVIRRVAESEGHILTRVSGLMWLVTLAALLAATLAVGAASATSVIERSPEVGLMKALGASGWLISFFFLAEQVLIALVGGSIGFGLGILLARFLGQSVFGIPPAFRLILFPVVLVLATLVALLGSLLPLRRAARLQPAPILRGE